MSNVKFELTDVGSIIYETPAGLKRSLSISDFIAGLKSIDTEMVEAEVGTTFVYPEGLHSVTKVSDGYIVSLYYAERTHVVTHSRWDDSKTIVAPNVMIRVKLTSVKGKDGEWAIRDIKWYATEKGRLSLPEEWPSNYRSSDGIYPLCMPNIFGDANMCYGGNSLPGVVYKDWTILDSLYHSLLFGSQFNNDLSVPGVSDGPSGGSSWLDLLARYARDGERFPYNRLG